MPPRLNREKLSQGSIWSPGAWLAPGDLSDSVAASPPNSIKSFAETALPPASTVPLWEVYLPPTIETNKHLFSLLLFDINYILGALPRA